VTRARNILLSSSAVVLLIIIVLGWIAYGEFHGGSVRFDEDFYASQAKPLPFGYAPYAAVLKQHVNSRGLVTYAALKADRDRLDEFVRMLAEVDPSEYTQWDRPRKIAFWTNAYNALTLKAIIDHYPIRAGLLKGQLYPRNSIRQIPGVWDKLQFLVMGRRITLNQIEHEVLRKEFKEPRIHMTLVCAAMSCPPLRVEPYSGERLEEQLADQSRRFLAREDRFRIDREGQRVYLSKILEWFGGDFVEAYPPPDGSDDPQKATLAFVATYLPKADAEFIRAGDYSVSYLKYDWTLNERSSEPPASQAAQSAAPEGAP
jgi:uncharacterized protein DUF547